MTEHSKLRAAAPVAVAGLILIPIEQVRNFSYTARTCYYVAALKEPVAVLICGEGISKALDIEGRETALDDLILQVPGLEALLEKHCR